MWLSIARIGLRDNWVSLGSLSTSTEPGLRRPNFLLPWRVNCLPETCLPAPPLFPPQPPTYLSARTVGSHHWELKELAPGSAPDVELLLEMKFPIPHPAHLERGESCPPCQLLPCLCPLFCFLHHSVPYPFSSTAMVGGHGAFLLAPWKGKIPLFHFCHMETKVQGLWLLRVMWEAQRWDPASVCSASTPPSGK